MVTMLYMRITDIIHLITENLYPFTNLSQFPFFPQQPLENHFTTLFQGVQLLFFLRLHTDYVSDTMQNWSFSLFDLFYIIMSSRASLVAQWLRICLPMQGTWVRALVWEDPTCCGATGPVSHNC